MQPEFWIKKWEGGTQGFNQTVATPLLVKHFSALELGDNSSIFVPLCGKSIDMIWLVKQGYNVVGCELVEPVVQSFFSEQKIEVIVTTHPTKANLKCYQGQLDGQDIRIWSGNIFDLSADDIGHIDGVYDRAALVALPDNESSALRQQYAEHVIKLTNKAPQLLITLALSDENESIYDKIPGPPFFIPKPTLLSYFDQDYSVVLIAHDEDGRRTSKGREWRNLVWHLLPKS